MDDVKLRVAVHPCNECLFSRAKVVDDPRKQQILEAVAQEQSHFVCHKFTIEEMEGRMTGEEANVCCAGFYLHEDSLELRLARMLNIVEFVELPEGRDATE